MDTTQNCSCCGKEKELSCFHKQASAKRKHKKICKECVAAKNKNRYKNNKESILAKNKAWRKKNKESILEDQDLFSD